MLKGLFLLLERFYWFDNQIQQQRYPNARTLAEKFEINERTAQRSIKRMQLDLKAPLVYDRQHRGYTYETPFTLPPLPLSQAELLAVLLAQNLLATDNGYLSQAIQSFGRKLFARNSGIGVEWQKLHQHFSAEWPGHSTCDPKTFDTVCQGLLHGRKLSIVYHSPQRDETTKRLIHPHHLRHYGGSWLLLAWCELRRAFRRFFLSRIQEIELLNHPFERRPAATWRHLLDQGYGAFQGEELIWVRLRFTPHMARWVAEQRWHLQQRQERTEDGDLILSLPVADFREIKLKVLQFGAHVRVLEPDALRREIMDEIEAMKKIYHPDTIRPGG